MNRPPLHAREGELLPRADSVDAMETTAAPALPLRLWHIALRRRWVILGSIAIAIIGGIILSLLATPLYTATNQIEIAREGNRVVEIQSVERETSQFDLEFYQTQYGLLKSDTLAEKVARNLRLYDDPAFIAAFGRGGEAAPKAGAAIDARNERIRRASAILLAGVEISPVRSSRLVDISFTSPNPALSARIANAWGTNFIQMNLERRFEATSYARRFLEGRLTQLRERLEASERALVTYAQQQQIINLPGTVDRTTGATVGERSLAADDLAALNQELARATADRITAEATIGGSSATASSEVTQNPAITGLRQRRADANAEYSKLMAQFGPEYPPAKAISQQIAALDRSIAREEGRVGTQRSDVLRAAIQRESQLKQRVDQLKNQVTDLRGRSIQYGIFQREVDTNRQLYDGLLQRYKEIGIAGGVGTNNISVVDTAQVPAAPSSPNYAINMLLSLLFGLALGVAATALLEQIDEGISEPADVPRILGVPLLGVVPKTEDENPLLALGDPRSPIVESYLAVQTNLELSTAHGAPRSIAVTSTRPQEGKSTTAYALAQSLARAGRRVVLIDGDMRSPSVHHEFGFLNEAGLSNVLAGEENLEKLLQPTQLATLKVMTAGPQPPNAADLLVGDRLRGLIQKLLAGGFDHIVVDSPPVMGLADAPLIASVVEGAVYAVEARTIRTSRVRAAMARLRNANINLLGAVVTKFSTKHSQYSYAYDYQYGYGRQRAA